MGRKNHPKQNNRGQKRPAQHDEVKEAILTAQNKRKSCTSKKRYPSRNVAEAAIFGCEENGTTGLTCYECPICGGWHLTSHGWEDSVSR